MLPCAVCGKKEAQPVRIGMISFAHMHAYSYAHLARMIDDVVLVAIADEDKDRGTDAARRFGATYCRDYRELLQNDIDAVVVCSENARHAEHVIAAAQAGKHILCEKPLASTLRDARAMVETCASRGVILAQAFPVRHVPAVVRAKSLIDAGKIGQVLAASTTNHGRMPGGWFTDRALAGGGAVMDHTVHVVDVLRWFLGDEVKRVYAEVDTRFHDVPIDDCGTLAIEFRGGVFATLDPSWSRPKSYPTWGDVTMEIVGTHGVISIDAFAQMFIESSDREGAVFYRYWGDDMDLLLVRDFVKAVKTGGRPAATGQDGLRALEVALAAYWSTELGAPVELPSNDLL